MSSADIIRRYIENSVLYRFPPASAPKSRASRQAAADALNALVAEIQQQADRIAWLEGDVAGWRIKLAAAQAENQRLRAALEEIRDDNSGSFEELGMIALDAAHAALRGTDPVAPP